MSRLARTFRRHARIALVGAGLVVTSAHVGSPNVYFAGKAGAYDVDVVIRPPSVIPGRAEITVRLPASEGSAIRRVTVRPVYWHTGTKGSPQGELAQPVAAPQPTYSAMLWMMAGGAYTVLITVDGTLGTGTATVPVDALPTARLPLPGLLKGALVVLGLVLFFGLLTIVHAAIGESRVAPGAAIEPRLRRRARIATAIAFPLLLLVVFGGWTWWQSEARAYERRLFRNLDVRLDATGDSLRLVVTDSLWARYWASHVVPDQGKLMHMFVVREPALDAFAHLHPSMPDSLTFATALPGLPAGRYRVYGDVVHETGFEQTLLGTVELPGTSATRTGDADDSWITGTSAVTLAPGASAPLGDGLTMRWVGTSSAHRAGGPAGLRFAVRDAAGKPVTLEPYMGMDGHAVVMRDDGAVFVHLHPMGTIATASQQLFTLRERGDTTADGHLRVADLTAMREMGGGSEVSFPYAFPRSGRYHVWVQVRRGGKVRTGAFVVAVADSVR